MTIVTTRTVPWLAHGALQVDQPVLTAREAAELGGIDFQVEKRPLYFGPAAHGGAPGTPMLYPIEERCAVVRADTEQWLGIMSNGYPLLQYADAFDFLETVSSRFVAAGALRHGRQGFVVAETRELFEFNLAHGSDLHHLYLVLRTSHDGSRAVEVTIQALRGLCTNQLTLRSFTRGVPFRWSVPHTSTMQDKLAQAKISLQNLSQYAGALSDLSDRLVDVKLTESVAERVLAQVIGDRPRAAITRRRILEAWQGSPTVGYAGTGWGLVNAVSEYMDWGRSGGTPESRFLGAIEGKTFKAINRATALVLTHHAVGTLSA